MSNLNPTLEGWALVISNGYSFLGRPSADGARLSPVYTVMSMIGPKPENPREQGVVHMIQPVHLLTSINEIPIPSGAITIPMSDVALEERKNLAKFVGLAEKLAEKIRVSNTGLTVLGH